MNNFAQLLQQSIKGMSVEHPVIRFKITNRFPSLFFSHFVCLQDLVILDITQKSAEIKLQLETSFLGLTQHYWLGFLDLLPKSQQQEWDCYLDTYQGPNKLFYASTVDGKTDMTRNVFVIPDHIDKNMFKILYAFLMPHEANVESHIKNLFAKAELVDLDCACLLVHYFKVIGSQSKEFFECWLPKLMMSQQSLFSLSQYFFAQQRKQFIYYWQTIKDDYPDQFWISYWSDQIWRAAFYCKYMSERKYSEAKKIGYRLPFGFLQKYYKGCSFYDLLNMHQKLYVLDYELKNGASSIGLDVILLHFFTKHYS